MNVQIFLPAMATVHELQVPAHYKSQSLFFLLSKFLEENINWV